MSLRRAMRNARKAINYGIGMSERDAQRAICAGVSFDPAPALDPDPEAEDLGPKFENLMEQP